MKKCFFIIVCCLTLFVTNACDKEWDNLDSNQLDSEILRDFNYRNPDAKISKTSPYDFNHTAYINFTDKNGFSSTAVYFNGVWSLTQKEYDKNGFLLQLPRKVARAFIGTGVENEDFSNDNSYAVEISRNNFPLKQYEFHFTTPSDDGSNLVNDIVIDENGDLLTFGHGGYNRSIWWYDMESSVECVFNKYPSADLLGTVNFGGNLLFFISDNGIQKTVTIHHSYDWGWMETRYKLDDLTTLPDVVLSWYTDYHSQHPDERYSAVYYIENKSGEYYGLRFGDSLNNETFFIQVK